MATIYEVAKLAGVSLATVSRVINNSDRVREPTRQKVLAAMVQLDYRPNSIAQSLALSRSNSVGILVPELHGPFFGTMVSAIEAELRGAGKHVIVTVGHSNEAKEKESIEFLASRNCDAIIVHVDDLSDDCLTGLCQGPVPIVVLGRLVPAIPNNCISLNNLRGGFLATRYALDLGHRDIAYIAGPLAKRDAQERMSGHQQALGEFGIEHNSGLVFEGDYEEASGSRGMNHFLSSGIRVSAVVCANDSMAAGAMRVARESGLVIPDDVSIIGFDNVVYARYLHPELSTVNYPINEMSQMAARWVLKHVYSQAGPEIQHLFQPRLVTRQSVRRWVN